MKRNYSPLMLLWLLAPVCLVYLSLSIYIKYPFELSQPSHIFEYFIFLSIPLIAGVAIAGPVNLVKKIIKKETSFLLSSIAVSILGSVIAMFFCIIRNRDSYNYAPRGLEIFYAILPWGAAGLFVALALVQSALYPRAGFLFKNLFVFLYKGAVKIFVFVSGLAINAFRAIMKINKILVVAPGSFVALALVYLFAILPLLNSVLIDSVKRGDKNSTALFLTFGADINYKDKRNSERTPLMIAIDCDHYELARFIAEKNVDINKADSNKSTALMLLADKGTDTADELAAYVIESKSNVDYNLRDDKDVSFIMRAGMRGRTLLIDEILLKDPRVSTSNVFWTIIYLIEKRTREADLFVLKLLEKYPDIASFSEKKTRLLSHAVLYNRMEIIRKLIDIDPDIDTQDITGRTALMIAGISGSVDAASLLIEHNADYNRRDNADETVLNIARRYKSMDLVRYLEGIGAEERFVLPDNSIIKSTESSSMLTLESSDFYASNVSDCSTLCWSEGVAGDGIGEYLTMSLTEIVRIDEIYIQNGYGLEKDFFKYNRVKDIDINGQRVMLEDTTGLKLVSLRSPIIDDKLILTIVSVYEGSDYDNTCLTEISFSETQLMDAYFSLDDFMQSYESSSGVSFTLYLEPGFISGSATASWLKMNTVGIKIDRHGGTEYCSLTSYVGSNDGYGEDVSYSFSLKETFELREEKEEDKHAEFRFNGSTEYMGQSPDFESSSYTKPGFILIHLQENLESFWEMSIDDKNIIYGTVINYSFGCEQGGE